MAKRCSVTFSPKWVVQTRAPKLLVAQKGRVVGCVFMHDLNDGTRVLVAKQTKKEEGGWGGGEEEAIQVWPKMIEGELGLEETSLH